MSPRSHRRIQHTHVQQPPMALSKKQSLCRGLTRGRGPQLCIEHGVELLGAVAEHRDPQHRPRISAGMICHMSRMLRSRMLHRSWAGMLRLVTSVVARTGNTR